MLNVTYTYRLKLTPQQSQTYEAWLETSRRVWNFGLGERKDWYNSRSCRIDACSLKSEYIISADAPRPTFASQCKALTQARKTNPNGTSQTCPNCNHHTGKKDLDQRVHRCSECGFETSRDIAAAMVVMQRGLAAVGHTVKMFGEGLSSSSLLTQESPVL